MTRARQALALAVAGLALAVGPGCRDDGPRAARSDPAPALSSARNDDALTGGGPGQPPALPDGVRDVDGVVVRARSGTVVIQPPDGETVVLGLTPDVPVTIEGEASSTEAVREGTRVRAAYTFEDGDARAVRIEVEPAPR